MPICNDPFQMFETFFYYMLIQTEENMKRMQATALLFMIIPPIVVGAIIAIILIIQYKKGNIGGGSSKSIGEVVRRMDKSTTGESPLKIISKSRQEKINEKLMELDYKCKFCNAELKGEVCDYCGRTNFRI
ncbi:MAG: hypothetical protein ACTSRG_17010 [Candidatus Helarchaeota archaeon]